MKGPEPPGGLGRAIALALAEAGADVALGLRDVKQDGGVVSEIEALGRKAMPLQMEMGDLEQVRAISAVPAQLGKLDILVNNTGIAPTNLALDVREERFALRALTEPGPAQTFLIFRHEGTTFTSLEARVIQLP